MTRSNIIKLILAAFSTAIFVFSAVPKIVFHELFADHDYKSYYHIPDEHPHIDPPSASCDCVCNWFDQHFDNTVLPGVEAAPLLVSFQYGEALSAWLPAHHPFSGLRGPPSMNWI